MSRTYNVNEENAQAERIFDTEKIKWKMGAWQTD